MVQVRPERLDKRASHYYLVAGQGDGAAASIMITSICIVRLLNNLLTALPVVVLPASIFLAVLQVPD